MLTQQRSVVLGGALLCFVVASWLTAGLKPGKLRAP